MLLSNDNTVCKKEPREPHAKHAASRDNFLSFLTRILLSFSSGLRREKEIITAPQMILITPNRATPMALGGQSDASPNVIHARCVDFLFSARGPFTI